MGFFDFLKQANINQGIEEYKRTAGAVLLDVRTPQEYQEGHIPESKNVPLQQLNNVLLLGTVISLVVIGITKTGSFNEIFLTAGSLFPTILLILSIMLPFILKFGGEKGRIAIIGVMGFIFVIGLLLIKTTEYLGIDLYVLINKLPKFEPLVYIILFLLLSVVILGISYLISLTILKKKEF